MRPSLLASCSIALMLASAATARAEPPPGRLGVSWPAWNRKGFAAPQRYVERVQRMGIQAVTLVPTYSYAGRNRIDFTQAPTWPRQRAALQALLEAGLEVVYKPHLDPLIYQPGFNRQQSDAHSWRVACPWRGYFDLDPMAPDYADKVVGKALEEIAAVLRQLPPAKVAPVLRFELGTELMNSVVHFPARWLALLRRTRAQLRRLGLKGQVQLSHNFSHHLLIPEDLVERLDARGRRHLGRYVAGLDAVALSQYMDLTAAMPKAARDKRLPTADEVAAALRQHEAHFIDDILLGRLAVPKARLPEIHLGEFGVGSGGLRHPNVWEGDVRGQAYQRLEQEIIRAYEGLMRYLHAGAGRRAQSAVLWTTGRYFDVFGWQKKHNRIGGAVAAVCALTRGPACGVTAGGD
ncbi:MAG: hypothetical protein ACPGUV_04375 [Polyangiales bacterium]